MMATTGVMGAMLALALGGAMTASAAVDADGFVEQHRYMPPGDPNLDPNWDWTGSGPGHTVYYTDLNGIIRSKLLQVPFYTGGHPLNTLQKDMYREDGWVLAFRDFGSPAAAPDVPFFALYNRYRGLLRIMLYNSRELTYSRFNVELSFKSAAAAGALLTYSEPTRAFRDDYDPAKTESFLVEAYSINGWIHGDFMLTGYDPTTSAAAQLRLKLRGINVENVILESTEFTLSQLLTDANPGSSQGTDLVASANQGHKFYKDAERTAKALREAASQGSQDKWWQVIVKSFVGTTSQPTFLAKVAPMVGGLVGFIKSFIGGADEPAPREPLNFEGSLKMNGSITLSQPLYAMDFGLKPGTGGNPPDYYRPLNPIAWGLFNLNTKPLVYSKLYRDCPRTDPRCDVLIAEAYLKSAPSYVFNTAAGVQLVSVRYAFTFNSTRPTPFAGRDLYYSQVQGPPPTGLAVRVALKALTPTLYSDDDIVFYKVYPITRTTVP